MKRSSRNNLPSTETRAQFDRSSGGQIWILITAFLSMKSPATQVTYRGVIQEWCEFLGGDVGSPDGGERIAYANHLAAAAYKNWLDKQTGQRPRHSAKIPQTKALAKRSTTKSRRDGYQSTLANATVRKKFAALRRIYRMLQASDIGIKNNPFDTDRVPPPPAASGQKRPTEMIDFSLVKKIIETPSAISPKGRRDRAILAALFGGGLRRGEAVALRIADVRRTQKGTLYLRLRATKGKKDSDQPLPKWAAKYINDLLAQRSAECASQGDYLFVSYRGRAGQVPTSHPLSDSGLYRLFKYYCSSAGAGEFLSPHSARATAITKLLADGIGHREVQEFSRHASVQMVEVYDKRRIGVDENPAKELDFE